MKSMRELSVFENMPPVVKLLGVIDVSLRRGSYTFGEKGRPEDGFLYVLEGGAHYDLDGFSFDAEAGSFFLLTRSVRYICSVRTHLRVLIANVLLETPEDSFYQPTLFPASGKKTEKQFFRLLSAWQLMQPGAKLECMSVLYEMYADAVGAAVNNHSAGKQRQMEEALQFIHAHIREENLSVARVAAHVGLSEAHFRRCFTAFCHLPPARYIRTVRMEQAKEQLQYGGKTVTEIAALLGFTDVFYFSHAFRREVGCAPGEYRAMKQMSGL